MKKISALIFLSLFLTSCGSKKKVISTTKKQKELDVQLIFVDLDTREVLDVMPTKKSKQVKKTDMTNVVPFGKIL